METTEKSLTGIELLKTLDRVLIREKASTNDSTKYVVLATDGTVMLYANEDADFINRMLGKSRTLELKVFDGNDKEERQVRQDDSSKAFYQYTYWKNKRVIKFRRPYTIGTDKMDVSLGGQVAAIVRKEVTFFKPVLSINDANDHPVIRVKGPMFITSECNFELYSNEKERIGDICKRWSGSPGWTADKNTFAARFPLELDVRYKAAIIGSCFLIDFLFYEN